MRFAWTGGCAYDHYSLSCDGDVGPTEVKKSADGGDGSGIDEVPSVIEHTDIDLYSPHLFSRTDAQRFGIDGTTVPKASFDDLSQFHSRFWSSAIRTET